jgi:hypothetical protein
MQKTIEKTGDIGQFVPMATSIAFILIKVDAKGGW